MLDYKGLKEGEIQELIDTEAKIRKDIKETWEKMNENYKQWLLKQAVGFC